jgi:hypothetical protein
MRGASVVTSGEGYTIRSSTRESCHAIRLREAWAVPQVNIPYDELSVLRHRRHSAIRPDRKSR